MKVLFLGYQSIGHVGLRYLLDTHEEVQAVVTHRDDPHETIWWKSVADLAKERGVKVVYFDDLDFAGLDRLVDELRPQMMLSFYFRKMVPTKLLAKFERGGLNMHGSYLPKYRGRAPANWVLVNGESTTGMTLHEMVKKPDAGAIVDQERVPIAPRETIATLYPKLVEATQVIMKRAWPLVREGREKRVPQDERQATYFSGRKPGDGEIHWEWPARRVDCLVRAVTHPYPGAFGMVGGRKLSIWEGEPVAAKGTPGTTLNRPRLTIACAEGAFEVRLGQLEGEAETTGEKLKEKLS